jgi:hypothetical protein
MKNLFVVKYVRVKQYDHCSTQIMQLRVVRKIRSHSCMCLLASYTYHFLSFSQ